MLSFMPLLSFNKLCLCDGVRSRGPLAQFVIRRLHGLALDRARYRGIHHELGKTMGCFVQRLGAGAQRLEVIALLEHA